MFASRLSRRRAMAVVAGLVAAASGGVVAAASSAAAHDGKPKPTVVLVHGAFADSSSWNGVVARLQHDGYPVIAAANPLRGLASDAAYVSAVVHAVTGPVILVGHSYGGSVISNAATGNANVKAHRDRPGCLARRARLQARHHRAAHRTGRDRNHLTPTGGRRRCRPPRSAGQSTTGKRSRQA